jgi:pyridoxamine 5'-phosphate oxidase
VPERTLNEADLHADPIEQFTTWLQEAWDSGEPFANAMALATTDHNGLPTVRMLLLDHVDQRGLTFQTNLESPKAHHLQRTSTAALLFFWPKLLRQVRVSGRVERLPREEIETYWASAPPGIQAMIRACRQSQPVASRAELEHLFQTALDEAPNGGAAIPPDWGGFRLAPDSMEFWQGREHRLQDRLRLTRLDGGWRVERLMP